MKTNPDDPKWTAYVLGELNDAECAAAEKELESSAEAREIVDEIRATTMMLKEELARKEGAALTSTERQAILAAARAAQKSPAWYHVRQAFTVGALAATVLLVVATLSIPTLLRSRQAAGPGHTGVMTASAPTGRPAAQAEFGHYEPRGVQDPSSPKAVPQNEFADPALRKAEPSSSSSSSSPSPAPAGPIAETAGFLNSFVARAPSADAPDRPRFNTEAYDFISDNNFIRVSRDPLATFSVDVDTASYANLRRFLNMNQLPPKDAVRIEEMVNYFTYDYAPPTGSDPIATYAEIAAAPWKPEHRLVRIGIKGKEVDLSKRPPGNLVFLIDVSGSMADAEKLPLLKSSMKLLIDKLTENDRVAIVVYAGASGMVLPPTSGDKKSVLAQAVDRLESGGSTNGAAGIQLAYDTAVANFIRGGINRVILATDGDFNVGVTNQGDLTRLIEEKAKSGVFLTVLGFGMGNYKDSTLEKLADKGNGNYAYIDTLKEARKALVEELGGALMTIAKDVKIQIEFNPAQVNAYRLIGYENRVLRHEDFNDDKKDAGDMGAGHSVTALFEVVPRGVELETSSVDPLKYQQASQAVPQSRSGEMLNIKFRYKEPESSTSRLLEYPVVDRYTGFNDASADFRFAAAVASFGMILRDSPHKGQSTLDAVLQIADRSRGADRAGYRDEFVQLVRKAIRCQTSAAPERPCR